MSGTIGIDALRPGDILLHRGTSFVSRGIQLFDGSPVSHASLYLGGGKIGEAVAHGLVENDYHASFHGNEWVKAYRLAHAPADLSPVLRVARRYLDQGNRYGFEQIVILALLSTTRKIMITPVLRRLLRTLLDAAAAELSALFRAGKEPMICSEFVYRVYDEVDAPDPAAYAIKIPGMLPLPQEAPAALAAAPMAPAISDGRGVHPESLAALLGTAASGAWLEAPVASAAPMALAAPAAKPPSQRTLSRELKAYLQEVEMGESAAARQTVSLEELRAAMDRFAVALYDAKAGPSPAGALAAAPDPAEARSAAYAYLFRAAADFVTPRDLYTTESLELLGTVALH